MMRLALSLKERTAPAHVIAQRLTNSCPPDRLSKAIPHLGRVIKTEYILLYLTDAELRRTVQRQLNKGEYRQKLPRRIFFADPGEFTTEDYVEIVNKASCLSLVSNAILYWNTIKIAETVGPLRAQGEDISDETLAHTSLCCRSGMSCRMERTLSRTAKLGEKAVAHSNCAQNRNILFKFPRWSH